MKNILYVLLLLITSCNQKQEIIKEKHIDNLSEGTYKMPSKYGGLTLFVLSDDGDIIVTNSDYLNYVYEKHYLHRNNTYKDFLIKVLNNKNKIKKEEFDNIPFRSFKIDTTVEKKYQEHSFDNFIEEYTIKSKSTKERMELNSKNKSYQEIMTIAYYFYINGYQVLENDYSAKYSIVKRDRIFEIK